MDTPRFPRSRRAAAAALLTLAVAGCSSGPPEGPTGSAAPDAPTPSSSSPASTSPTTPAPTETPVDGYPSAAPRGLAVYGGGMLLATDEGVFSVLTDPVLRLGPAIDVAGFAAGADGALFASGTPAADSGLPAPLGLARSTDGGRSWDVVARGGESEFAALAAVGGGVVGYDGLLRSSPDLREWTAAEVDFVPLHLAGFPGSRTVLAATADGPLRSDDGGATWKPVANAPLFVRTAFADASTAVAVTGDGSLFVSGDGGLGWEQTGEVAAGNPGALAAAQGARLEIWVAVDGMLRYSDDGGATFRTIAGDRPARSG